MAYHVRFAEPVRDYLARVEGLTDDDRAAVVDEVIGELSRDADRFLALYPLGPESLCFRYDYARVGGAVVYQFDFVVDASRREVGVVSVVYVDCTPEPLP